MIRRRTLGPSAGEPPPDTGALASRTAQPGNRYVVEPCPGCGEAKHYVFRPVDAVCDACLLLMWKGEDAMAAEQAAPDGVELLCIPVRRWSDSPAWPRWYGSYSRHNMPIEYFERALADLLYALLKNRTTAEYWERDGKLVPSSVNRESGAPPTYQVNAPIGVSHLIEQLDQAGRAALEEIYQEGLTRGRSFVAELAAGTITNEEFDAARIRR